MGITLKDNGAQKIVGATYKNNDLQLEIKIEAFSLYPSAWPDDIGNILEKYRELIKDKDRQIAENHFREKKPILDKFVSRLKMTSNDFIPDYLTIFYPSDTNRNGLLKDFSDNLTSYINNKDAIDFSNNFRKKNSDSSITDGLNKEDFTFNPPSGQETITNLLIIDDVINEGRTLKIFLDKLYDEGLIGGSTQVKLFCLYCIEFKDTETKNSLAAVKELLKVDKSNKKNTWQ